MPLKKYLRLLIVNFTSLWLLMKILPGVTISGGLQSLAMAALALMIVNLLIKPLIKLLLLPINLITLGAFRWVVNVLALYLVTIFVPALNIQAFSFNGFTYQGFIIPAMHLSIFWVYILASFLLSLITSLILWLIH